MIFPLIYFFLKFVVYYKVLVTLVLSSVIVIKPTTLRPVHKCLSRLGSFVSG